MNLLLIEDDINISLALAQALSDIYRVERATNGLSGIQKATAGKPDIILLDLHLPDMHGLQICKAIRSGGFNGPLIILTAENKALSKIQLLDAGADDYITKPFSVGELKARLRVLQRRKTKIEPFNAQRLTIEDLTLDRSTHTVERAGKSIVLRRKEFALLECLMEHAGTVVTRDALGSHAWRENEDPWTNTIDVHIKYLRDKIDRPYVRPLIKTVHGLGYKLEVPQPNREQ